MTVSTSLQTDTKDDTLMMTIKVILILKQNMLPRLHASINDN